MPRGFRNKNPGERKGASRGASALGPALIALGSMLLTRITPVGGAAWVVVGYALAGVGIVCTVVTTTIAATASLGPELQGLAAGLLNTSQQVGTINWQFRTADARIKLKRLYPVQQPDA